MHCNTCHRDLSDTVCDANFMDDLLEWMQENDELIEEFEEWQAKKHADDEEPQEVRPAHED